VAKQLEIIDGPDAVFTTRECDTFRWRVRHPEGEQSVYVEIAWALLPDALEDPLRSAVETKGETPLLALLEEETVPARIKMTAAGIFVVDADGREGPL
jgi:hypothetical protein